MTSTEKADPPPIDRELARAMLKASPDALVVIDDDGVIELFNQQACTLFGYSDPNEVLGSRIEVLLPDRFAQTHTAHRTRYRAAPEVRTMGSGMELRAKRSDGSEVPVEISLSPLTLGGRHVVMAAIRDITERLNSEREALVIQGMLDATEDGIFMFPIDEQMFFTYVNDGAVNQTSYSRDELLSMGPLHILPEFSRSEFIELIAPLATGSLSSLTYRTLHRRKDGIDVPVEVVLQHPTGITDEGEAPLLVAQVRDITERVRTEQQLLESTVQLGAAFHDGPVAMSIIEISPTADRVILEANQAMADLLGYPLEELPGMSVVDFTHPDDLAADDAATQEQVAGEQDSFLGRKRYLRADGSVVWVDLHVSTLTQSGDRLTTIGHSTNVTAQVEAEESRARSRATTEALAEVQAKLLAESPLAETLALICQRARHLARAESAVFARPVAVAPGEPPTQLHPVVIDAAESAALQSKPTPIDATVRPVLEGEQVLLLANDIETLMAPVDSLSGVDGVLIVTRSASVGPRSDHGFATMASFSQAIATALQLDEARRGHQRAELLEDRERIGRDMHDLVIGRLFATGMTLQSTTARVSDPATQDRLVAAVAEIDETIKEIRSSIYGVRSQEGWAKGAKGEILAVAADLHEHLGFEPRVNLSGTLDDLPAPLIEQLTAVLREAGTNTAKYANASRLDITVRANAGWVEATVSDDGDGFGHSESAEDGRYTGNGLPNMAVRAASLGGSAEISSTLGEGTKVVWTAPIAANVSDSS